MVKLGKNARSVSIVGVGCTPFKDFETHPETQGIGEGEAFGYAALEAIADAVVPAIRNRTDTGFCPMESAVWDISDPHEAKAALERKISEMMAKK